MPDYNKYRKGYLKAKSLPYERKEEYYFRNYYSDAEREQINYAKQQLYSARAMLNSSSFRQYPKTNTYMLTSSKTSDDIERIKSSNPVVSKGSKKQEDDTRAEKLKRWRTSVQALTIATRSAYAYGNLLHQDAMSTDRLQQRLHGFRATESLISAGLSLIPIYGPILTSAWSLAEQVFSKRVTNGMQRRGEASRIAYNFANYDLGKYGTYAYDNTSQEWVAQDANKVKARTLGQKQSV